MFGVLPPGVKISESFSDFEEPTLLSPAPIKCWPATLGNIAAEVIRDNVVTSGGHSQETLVISSGAGRIR